MNIQHLVRFVSILFFTDAFLSDLMWFLNVYTYIHTYSNVNVWIIWMHCVRWLPAAHNNTIINNRNIIRIKQHLLHCHNVYVIFSSTLYVSFRSVSFFFFVCVHVFDLMQHLHSTHDCISLWLVDFFRIVLFFFLLCPVFRERNTYRRLCVYACMQWIGSHR